MKRSKAETAETRKSIIKAATQRFGRYGIHATGLADVMAEAGLTHGGFYRHFGSKDQLVAEACTAGLDALIASSERATHRADTGQAIEAIITNYLTPRHRDDRAGGCPIAALGSELMRAEEKTRAAAAEGVERLIEEIVKHLPDRSPEAARAEAAYALSAMVGAITISRLVQDSELSDMILRETRKRLIDA
ncbi:MAG: TetR family transcriptional regulator [Proteobacteria bacterium ST_bin13]|nr:MAG: TetR family transcriptional regulator [Proteobacteria bacterium ST_bin13]